MTDQENAIPMRVVITLVKRYMQTVWLPAKAEGKISFEDMPGEEPAPVSVCAENGKWYAVADRDCFFDGTTANRVELSDKLSVRITVGRGEYLLYAENVCDKSNVYLPYYFEPFCDITIGRNEKCDVCYPSSFVSRLHATLHVKDGALRVTNENSTNGVFVNGQYAEDSELKPGDVLYVVGLCIVVGIHYFCMNNADGRVFLTSPKVRPIEKENDVPYGKNVRETVSYQTPFDRKPRKINAVLPKTFDIEMPPTPLSANKVPLLLRMGNPVVSGGKAIITGNYLSALTSMVFPFLTQGFTEKDRKNYETERTEKYRAYLSDMSQEIADELLSEKQILTQQYPDVATTLMFLQNKDRLWERRKSDEDFLTVRLGKGDLPMRAEKMYKPRKFELENDALIEEMYALAEEPSVVSDAPIPLSLKTDYVSSFIGDHAKSVLTARNIIAELALTHSYDEVKTIVFAQGEDADKLRFAGYLPHSMDNDRTTRFFVETVSDVQSLNKYLYGVLEPVLSDDASGQKKVFVKRHPAYVVFCASRELFDAAEVLKNIAASEEYLGVSIVTLFDPPPKECTKIISVDETCTVCDLLHPDMPDQPFLPDTVEESKLLSAMRELSGITLKLASGTFALPGMVTFLEMYGVGRVEYLNPLKRWHDNNPIKSLAAPIGIGTDGKLFYLDLHEKKQGPHGLIAGGTGSGKSEFIITYILSMAINYSPDEVAFILIDYKGGGLADAFVDEKRGIHLPHVVGTITNLDGASIARSLRSINSELKRRQEVFKKAKSATNEGTMDIYDYQRLYRSGAVSEPMPHLFIISDEFAELKKQEPEFMDELISIARIGRSLGVHLILATQKPTGVVNDQIWSNTKFRICLRVATKGDSMEMLKRPEAAEIRNTGRFYLQVGYNELFSLGQSAWCGAPYFPQDQVVTEIDSTVQFVDNVGRVVLNAKPVRKNERQSEGKQIVSIVKYLSDLTKKEKIVPKTVWCPPLPAKIELLSLSEQKVASTGGGIQAMIGMADDPVGQRQFVYLMDLMGFHHAMICGGSGSGKSSFLRTLLYSLSDSYSPEDVNYYLLDMSGGALSALAKAPHCGAYLTEEDGADFPRLLTLIRSIASERKKLFADAGVSDFSEYRQIRRIPLILFVFDNYAAIQNFRNGPDYYVSMNEYMKECAAYGIRFVLTCNHLNEVHSKTRQEIDYRLALQAKDKYEYSDILDCKCAITAPQVSGRGIAVFDGTPLECHVAVLHVTDDAQTRAAKLTAHIEEIASRYAGKRASRILPMADANEEYETFLSGFAAGRIPLGYSLTDMKPVALPFRQLLCMPVYFGNPIGTKPIWENLFAAAAKSRADIVFLKRAEYSIFDTQDTSSVEQTYPATFTVLTADDDGLRALRDKIMQEIGARNVFRDAYCEKHGIPSSDSKRILKAADYVAANTSPLFIVAEGFTDLCSTTQPDKRDLEDTFAVFFEKTKGYNIYYIGGFYPEDNENTSALSLIRSFTKSGFGCLFGGRFDKQCLFPALPFEYKKETAADPKYDKFIMCYENTCYRMRMPCGECKAPETDPDEAPII